MVDVSRRSGKGVSTELGFRADDVTDAFIVRAARSSTKHGEEASRTGLADGIECNLLEIRGVLLLR